LRKKREESKTLETKTGVWGERRNKELGEAGSGQLEKRGRLRPMLEGKVVWRKGKEKRRISGGSISWEMFAYKKKSSTRSRKN